jgi:hypothetical protein
MKTRILMTFLALALALANTAAAAPAVSGDGACGVRAVDNESFLTCEGDRAPEPASAPAGPVPDDPEGTAVAPLACRLVDGTGRRLAVAALGREDEVVLLCRASDKSRLAARS